eukprot:3442816-Pyramimonas_sp.AAC.1
MDAHGFVAPVPGAEGADLVDIDTAVLERIQGRRASGPRGVADEDMEGLGRRGEAKDLVMRRTKRERLGGLVHLPGIDRKTPALRGHVADVVIELTRRGVVGPYA